MSALSDFVNEYRSKSGPSRTFNVANLGSNVANAFKGYLRTDVADDQEALTDGPGTSGTLPAGKNRRTGGWFGFGASDESQCCGLSRLQRIAFFFMCLIAAGFCFGTAILVLPMLIINTKKFATLNTLGSTFFLISFGFLWGPVPYIRFLLTPERRYVALAYLAALVGTLYTSLWLQNTLLTVVCATMQGLSLIWYVLTYIPGGERGLRFITSLCTGTIRRQASGSALPI